MTTKENFARLASMEKFSYDQIIEKFSLLELIEIKNYCLRFSILGDLYTPINGTDQEARETTLTAGRLKELVDKLEYHLENFSDSFRIM